MRTPFSTRTRALSFAVVAFYAGLLGACSSRTAERRKVTPEARPARTAPSVEEAKSAIAEARELGTAFSAVAAKVSPAVVSIRVETRVARPASPFRFFDFFDPFGSEGPGPNSESGIVRGNGSGVCMRSDGFIATNNHVVERASRIEVQFQDGRRYKGTVVGTDPATDLAVVRVQAKDLPAAPFADSNHVQVGEWVLAIGSPFGLDYTVTVGVVSAIGRGGLGANEIEDYLQTDASINPGNSGGPLVNLRGEVVGINTMIVGRGTGIGFAVPSNLTRNVTEQLIATGTVHRAWLGVGFQELTPELADEFGAKNVRGALVGSVVPGGPSAEAGIKPEDIIVAMDGKPIEQGHDLLRAVLARRVGEKVQLEIFRRGEKLTKTVKLGERPEAEGRRSSTGRRAPAPDMNPGFGLQVQPLTPGIADRLGLTGIRSGLVVTEIQPGSPAERQGLRPGDVIVEADRKSVENVPQLASALSDGTALLRVRRGDAVIYIVLSRTD